MKFGTVTHVRWAEAASLAASSLGFIVAEHFVETFHVASNQALQLAGVDTARRKAPVARFTLLARSGVRPNAQRMSFRELREGGSVERVFLVFKYLSGSAEHRVVGLSSHVKFVGKVCRQRFYHFMPYCCCPSEYTEISHQIKVVKVEGISVIGTVESRVTHQPRPMTRRVGS